MLFRRRTATIAALSLGLSFAALGPRLVVAQTVRAAPSANAASKPAVAAASPDDATTEPARSAPAASGYTLKQCLALADRNHPNIQASEARVAYMRAQLDEARTAPFSNFTLTAGAGPAPTFRGSAIYTQDTEVGFNSNIGMIWQANLSGTVPIWTFGKITNTWRAAEGQIRVGEYDVGKQRNAVHMDVRKAYFGLQLARDGLSLLADATGKLDKAIADLEKKLAHGDGDEIDLLRLRSARAELDARLAEAERGERVALAGLRFLTGIQQNFDIPQQPLRGPKHHLGDVSTYLEAAAQYRPEINQARYGVRAREAQSDLARSKLLPDLGITLFASYSRAPEITDQLNPFVRDDANYLRYGFGLGLRWSLDILPGLARVKQADAQLEETRQLFRYATGGVAVEVQDAHARVLEAKRRFEAYLAASKYTKQWLVQITQGIDVGTFEERDLVDPARQYALQRYNYLSALLDYNMAMAQLAQATGWDAIAEVDE